MTLNWQDDARAVMRQVYLFADLDEATLEAALTCARPVSLEKGRSLFTQGQPAEHLYLVLEGRIVLFLLSADGRKKVLFLKDRGQSFAEGALFIDELRYPVNARAITKCRLLAFDKTGLGELLCSSMALSRRLIATMHRRIQSLVAQVETLAFENATQRLVGYLLRQARDADSRQIVLSMPKHVLAAQLSIAPETLSRILLRLQRRGLIRVDGRRITLLEPDELLTGLGARE